MIKIVAEHFVKEESRDSFMVLARDLVNEKKKIHERKFLQLQRKNSEQSRSICGLVLRTMQF